MKIDCTIDGKTLTLSLNSDKPLSLILRDNTGDNDTVNHCNGAMCGLCTVLVDGKVMLSCMVPAFEIRGKNVTTFESFRKSKNMKDIEKAYESVGSYPCPECYASRSLIFESLIDEGITNPVEILKELSIVKCPCMDPEDEIMIVRRGIEIRRKRNVRRSQFA